MSVVHQAKVAYSAKSGGGTGRFFSTDGRWFYENQLPDPKGKISPIKYEREWLKQAAESDVIDSIEFTETEGERMALECTNSTCTEDATRIMGLPPGAVRCLYAAPYCDEHTQEVVEMGGLPVSGPALSDEAASISGIR